MPGTFFADTFASGTFSQSTFRAGGTVPPIVTGVPAGGASIEAALKTFLAESAYVAATVKDRVYRAYAPQKVTIPYIVIERINGGYEHELDGATDVAMPTLEVNCYGRSYGEAKDLSEAVRNRCDGYTGLMGTITVRSCLLTNETDHAIPPASGEGVPKFLVSTEYDIWYVTFDPTFV